MQTNYKEILPFKIHLFYDRLKRLSNTLRASVFTDFSSIRFLTNYCTFIVKRKDEFFKVEDSMFDIEECRNRLKLLDDRVRKGSYTGPVDIYTCFEDCVDVIRRSNLLINSGFVKWSANANL